MNQRIGSLPLHFQPCGPGPAPPPDIGIEIIAQLWMQGVDGRRTVLAVDLSEALQQRTGENERGPLVPRRCPGREKSPRVVPFVPAPIAEREPCGNPVAPGVKVDAEIRLDNLEEARKLNTIGAGK